MSLDKAIKHGKEKRKPYYGSKAFDSSCRNHGSCGYCEGNRRYQEKKAKAGMVFNGSMTDFQSDGTGSNPVTRSNNRGMYDLGY